MKPYYQDEWGKQYCSDALKVLSELEGDSLDLLATDPPYGISFMGKDWDKALPDIRIWRECWRVLKAGSFAFVMSIPRADCLSRMIISLEDAGFLVNFTPIFWAYASGFPKAQNIGKTVDKRLGAEREVIGKTDRHNGRAFGQGVGDEQYGTYEGGIPDFTIPASPQAKALDGSYGGFQPKPAVEVIIVAMKPLSEKTFVDQALKNQKGVSWLDDCRIPYESEGDKEGARFGTQMDIRGGNLKTPVGIKAKNVLSSQSGRFPANLLVSDDVLDDGRVTKSGYMDGKHIAPNSYGGFNTPTETQTYPDSGSFSRYFDLDKWWAKTFPFLIVPKASKSEKDRYLDGESKTMGQSAKNRVWADKCANCGLKFIGGEPRCHCVAKITSKEGGYKYKNYHPTVKPLKLMSYLITLGSREGDTVLDPFLGSGTTALASKLLGRKCIGIEIEEKYCEISANRCRQMVFDFGYGNSHD